MLFRTCTVVVVVVGEVEMKGLKLVLDSHTVLYCTPYIHREKIIRCSKFTHKNDLIIKLSQDV